MPPGNAHKVEVSLQVIVSRNQVSCLAENGSLENVVVIGISAQSQCARNRDEDCSLGDETHQRLHIAGGKPEATPQPGAAQDISDFYELGWRTDYGEIASEERCDNSPGRTVRFEEGRDPYVRIKQSAGPQGVSPSLRHAPG